MTDAPPAAQKDKGSRQYAALPWRRVQGGAIEVLLVTSRETRRWVIPKGWPMTGKARHKAAAQEAFEEAGVKGKVRTPSLGTYGYLKRLKGHQVKPITVTVYPLQVRELLDAWPERDQRTREWLSPEAAASRVQEPELADIIRRFAGLPTESRRPSAWRRLLGMLGRRAKP